MTKKCKSIKFRTKFTQSHKRIKLASLLHTLKKKKTKTSHKYHYDYHLQAILHPLMIFYTKKIGRNSAKKNFLNYSLPFDHTPHIFESTIRFYTHTHPHKRALIIIDEIKFNYYYLITCKTQETFDSFFFLHTPTFNFESS